MLSAHSVRGSLLIAAVPLVIAPFLLAAASPAKGGRTASAIAPMDFPRERTRLDGGWRFHQGDIGAQPLVDGIPVTGWKWNGNATRIEEGSTPPFARPDFVPEGADWKESTPGQDVFYGRAGFAWFRATLPDLPGSGRTLHFEGVDDNATVYVNGILLRKHQGWDEPFEVPLDSAWKTGGPNVVAVLVENTAGAGGIGEVRVQMAGTAKAETLPEPAGVRYDDRSWRAIHLPHDFVVEGAFTKGEDVGHGSLPKTVGWYRKTFTISVKEKGRRLWLDFDGVYRDSTVYLNGKLLGNHKSGYTTFRYDITDVANYGGPNILSVRADSRRSEGWWYEGGGIYRHVWLNSADPLHVTPTGISVAPKLAEPGADGKVGPAEVALRTEIVNEGAASATAVLLSRVLDDTGQTVGTASTPIELAAGGRTELAQSIAVATPRLWSLETPRLYRLVTEIRSTTHRNINRRETRFGIRTLRWDAEKGFFLNGKSVKIKGTCNHQDHAGMGIALPDSLTEWRLKKLKSMGSNAYRCSHNPPAAELLEACDRLGMLVMDENRHLGDTYRDHTPSGTGYSDLTDLKDLILRDRNHPSVIMWSLCNEEGLQGSEEGKRIFSAMMEVVHRYDTTRPISCAMNGGWGRGISEVEDVQGCNYNPGGYDGFHRAHPTMPMYGSETASAVGTRGIYTTDPARGYVNAYDTQPGGSWAQTAEVAWKAIAERPFVAGGFVWTGFDYKGEPTPYGWPCINSHFGILDICGFPKDAYWYYQSWWGDKPVVHVFPHWNWAGKEGQPIKVWVYSNADRVELFLNGKSLGEAKAMPRNGHLEWMVPYAPGTLEAKGYGSDGKVIKMDRVETTGAPVALRLETDRNRLLADGEDVAMVEVSVVDAKGRVVPTAGDAVTFAVSGAGHIAGVGNGDPSSHEPDKASQRAAFNGRCLAIVQTEEGKGGSLQLTATAPGLKPATLRLESRL